MKRISTATSVNNKFVDGDKSTGRKATQLNAEWYNQVQEEICKLLESAGITVGAGDADNQLVQMFTQLFVLQAAFKSVTCKKGFEGGYSLVEIDGETLAMSASGNSVTDNSSLTVSRLLQKFQKSISGGGSLSTEMSPSAILVKATGSGDAVYVVEIKNDRILFKSGDPLTERASIVYNGSDGSLEIDLNGVKITNDRISFRSGSPLAEHAYIAFDRLHNALDFDANEITFETMIKAVDGIEGDVSADLIHPKTAGDPISIGLNKSGIVIDGRSTADRYNMSSTSYIKSSSDVNLLDLNQSDVEPKVGDVALVTNTSSGDITVTIGYRENGHSGPEDKEVTVSAECSMAFVCIFFSKNANTNEIVSQWSPLSNVTVSWNPHVQGT